MFNLYSTKFELLQVRLNNKIFNLHLIVSKKNAFNYLKIFNVFIKHISKHKHNFIHKHVVKNKLATHASY